MLDLVLGFSDGFGVTRLMKKAPTKSNILFRLFSFKPTYFAFMRKIHLTGAATNP